MGTPETTTHFESDPQSEFPLLQCMGHLNPAIILSELLTTERRITIALLDEAGTFLMINTPGARSYRFESPLEVIGKNYNEFVANEWADERIKLIQRCMSEDRPITLLYIAGGGRVRARFVPIRAEKSDAKPSCVMMTAEQVSPITYDDIVANPIEGELLVHSKYVELGPMDVLTRRELEVLALMRKGLRAKDIVKELCRAESTIQRHREKIGQKLGMADRNAIINMADEAVLQLEDGSRERIVIRLRPELE